jgi:hypothetical protein
MVFIQSADKYIEKLLFLQMYFTPTPLQKATTVKSWINTAILSRKRETDKAIPVKV